MKKDNYKKIRAEWYSKLRASGFEDIETSKGDLKQSANRIFAREKNSIVLQAKLEYYQMAYAFLNSYNFESNIERIIWEYHTNALSSRSINKLLNEAKVIETNNHTSIWQVIKRLRATMMGKK